jgi:predicted amino acid-binding ACT domain protein
MASTKVTALILFTGPDNPEASTIIFKTLSPFSTAILDTRHFVIRGRVFSTALIALDVAHAPAIEADLIEAAERTGMDVAVDLHPNGEVSANEAAHSHSLYRNTLIASEFSAAALDEIYRLLKENGADVIFTSVSKSKAGHELLIESTGNDPLPALRQHSVDWKNHS